METPDPRTVRRNLVERLRSQSFGRFPPEAQVGREVPNEAETPKKTGTLILNVTIVTGNVFACAFDYTDETLSNALEIGEQILTGEVS